LLSPPLSLPSPTSLSSNQPLTLNPAAVFPKFFCDPCQEIWLT
jgi:hypothetical protein